MNSSKEPSQFSLHVCSSVQYESMPEWKLTYLTTAMSSSLISISVINLLLAPCTIFLNVLVLIAVKTSPRLRNNCNILLASLAGTDLLTGALGQPLTAAVQIYRLTSSDTRSVCLPSFIRMISAHISVLVSLQLLALLSIERYIAIKYPFKYLEMVTQRRLTVTIVFAWIFTTCLAFVNAFNTANNVFSTTFRNLITVGSISILIFCQIAVYQEARNQMRKIKNQQIPVGAKETFLKDKRALNTTTIVIGVVLLSFVPLLSFRLALKFLKPSPITKIVMEAAVRSLSLCNSVCNPLIYCVRNREFRQAFKRLLSRQNNIQPAW